jgi:hypothetical protein
MKRGREGRREGEEKRREEKRKIIRIVLVGQRESLTIHKQISKLIIKSY